MTQQATVVWMATIRDGLKYHQPAICGCRVTNCGIPTDLGKFTPLGALHLLVNVHPCTRCEEVEAA
jgi:hypothetical protein